MKGQFLGFLPNIKGGMKSLLCNDNQFYIVTPGQAGGPGNMFLEALKIGMGKNRLQLTQSNMKLLFVY